MKNVVLIGFPGSGKSTVGQLLATTLHVEFIDLDQAIEERYHTSIPHLFEKYGEFVFRKCENKVLKELLQQDNLLIATGGGAPCYPEAMKEINEAGTSIYLKMSEEALFERLKHSPKNRPLTHTLDDDGLRHYIDSTLRQREGFYKQATITIDVEDKTVEEIVEKLRTEH